MYFCIVETIFIDTLREFCGKSCKFRTMHSILDNVKSFRFHVAISFAGIAALWHHLHDYVVTANLTLAVVSFLLTYYLIPRSTYMFINSGLAGHDVNKKEKPLIPEGLGVLTGGVYVLILVLFIPFPFANLHFNGVRIQSSIASLYEFAKYLAALLSILAMILLGFVDDVLNLKWRYKVIFPTVAIFPVLMVYYVAFGVTHVMVPLPLKSLLGTCIDLGVFYYVYMWGLAVFCTNAINILAGVNGLEAGQSLVIAISIAINNLIQMYGVCCSQEHRFSFYLIVPFIGCTAALLVHNWFPSNVFVGDTFCYFAGMEFAVSGILSHSSKTMILFFIPQIFNFIYSIPQIFRMVPCPRHRMPNLNLKTGKIEPSTFLLEQSTPIGLLIVKLFSWLRLVRVTKDNKGKESCTNFTLINLTLLWFGPLKENHLTMAILLIQSICSCVGFFIRYGLVHLFYKH